MNERLEDRGISVITSQLPYIDRRSLSEAWFSALHLASDGPVKPPPERRAENEAPSDAGQRSAASRYVKRDAALQSLASAFGAMRRTSMDAPALLAALPAASRARRMGTVAERARSYPPFRTSLTFGVDGERVALLLRREGTTLHVVALCRPAIADLVRRALACADLHLRAGGDRVCARVETLPAGGAA